MHLFFIIIRFLTQDISLKFIMFSPPPLPPPPSPPLPPPPPPPLSTTCSPSPSMPGSDPSQILLPYSVLKGVDWKGRVVFQLHR